MSYTVSCSPAPLTLTIRPRFAWQFLLTIAWVCFIGYKVIVGGWRALRSADAFNVVIFSCLSVAALLSLIRRERIEVYPDRMVWRKTYFGFTRSKVAPLADVLGAEWSEADQQGEEGKGPDCVEFYLPTGSLKACYGFTFEDFDRMREEIRSMYPDLIKRWGRASVRSKTFTLLNLG